MPQLQRIKAKNKSCYLLKTFSSTFSLDFPAELFGKNHRIPSFDYPPKPIKFVIPSLKFINFNYVFVTNPELSFGIFFLPKNVSVFMTELVYEQLLNKLDYYQKLSVNYEDEEVSGRILDLNRIKIPKFTIINLNQVFYFNNISIKAISNGAFVGWINLLIKESYSLLYATGLFITSRFVTPIPDIAVDYLILNRHTSKNFITKITCTCKKPELSNNNDGIVMLKKIKKSPSLPGLLLTSDFPEARFEETTLFFGVDILTKYITKAFHEKIAILCDFASNFLEIFLHSCYILKDVPIYILGTNFEHYKNRLTHSAEFLNNIFRAQVYKGFDPFLDVNNTNLSLINDVSEITSKNYLLFTESSLRLSDTKILGINTLSGDFNFFIQFESSISAIYEHFRCKTLINSEFEETNNICKLHFNQNKLIPDETIFNEELDIPATIISTENSYNLPREEEKEKIVIKNSQLAYSNDNYVLLEGLIECTDKESSNQVKTIITCEEPLIRRLFNNENYSFFKNKYYFMSSGYVIDFENSPHIKKL